jgi:hypothetical protein
MRNSAMPKTIAKWAEKNKHIIDEVFMEDMNCEEDGHTHQCWVCLRDGWIFPGYFQHDFPMLTVKEFKYMVLSIVEEGKDADGNWNSSPKP